MQTFLDTSPLQAVAGRSAGPGRMTTDAGVTVTDTTELRWFVEGRLPEAVAAWFTLEGTTGLIEQRVDTYRIDGRLDTGVKRRFGETLELKVRRSLGEQVTLGPGLAGRLEVWRRWSPAECLVTGSRAVPWADVDKTIAKRRFSVDGGEIALTGDNRVMVGDGCDVEIAALVVDSVVAWTFAFAAYGTLSLRRQMIVNAMEALVGDRAVPDEFGPFRGPSAGYPEWLTLVTARSAAGACCDLRRR